MALRAFRCNPALGGFGNETEAVSMFSRDVPAAETMTGKNCESGDAFAQIVKELVDNAVDACSAYSNECNDVHALKRVRVTIERVDSGNDQDNAPQDNAPPVLTNRNGLLRITVYDDGCGMKDIEKCVTAFSSSKTDDETLNPNTGSDAQRPKETAGRYGIGLTLCLLHAQRLVPNSCAMIKSTIRGSSMWTVAKFVVDTGRDSVVCVEKKDLPKKKSQIASASGTAVSLLLPVRQIISEIFAPHLEFV